METLAFPPFRLDPADQRLWRGSEPLELRPKTFAVLVYLAERPGKLVRNEELLDAVWEGAAVTPGTLNTSIRELRKVLGDDARQPRFIETVHRRGFRFVAAMKGGHESATDPAGLTMAVGRCFDRLPEEQQQALTLRYRSGLSPAVAGRGSGAALVFEALGRLGRELSEPSG